ncbi:MAG: hypothetical protein U0P30_12960 [Vicinamibacterales bacterium]
MSAAVVPQTGVARMIRDIVRVDGVTITATAVIDRAHPLVVADEAPAYLGVEIGAQAAAALAAMSERADAPPQAVGGRLVRVRDAVFSQPSLPAGVVLDVTAECTGAFAPLATYRVQVGQGTTVAITATISTYTLGPASA